MGGASFAQPISDPDNLIIDSSDYLISKNSQVFPPKKNLKIIFD